MVGTILYIEDILVPTEKAPDIEINKQIKDLQQPEATVDAYTLPFELPRSREIDKLLGHIFDLNNEIDNTGPGNFNPDFDPNKKAKFQMFTDCSQQFDGVVQLMEIVTRDNHKISYKMQATGKFSALLKTIGEDELTALDLSEFNHDYTKDNVKNSWATSIMRNGSSEAFAYGNGYTYPLVDYGHSNNLVYYAVDALKPWVYAREYVNKIIAAAGFTHEGYFVDDTDFKHEIVSPNGSGLRLSSEAINNRSFYATLTSEQSLGTTYPTGAHTIIFDNDSVSPGFDNSGQWDTSTGKFTCGTGLGTKQAFTIKIPIRLDITVTDGSYAGEDVIAAPIPVYVRVFKYDAASTTTSLIYLNMGFIRYQDSFAYTFSTPVPGTSYVSGGNFDGAIFTGTRANEIYFAISNVTINAGDQIYVVLSAGNLPANTVVEDGDPSNVFTATYEIFALEDAYIYNSVSDATITEGMEMDLNGTIPLKIKQKDFLMSFFKMKNLYIEPDPTQDNHVFIKRRDDFYVDDVIDLSNKLDYNSDIVIKPMGALEGSRYVFKYKSDKDYYNQKHETKYQEPYGTNNYIVDNDFNKTEKKIEVVFSPTPSVGDNSFDRVIPRILQIDEAGVPSPVEFNIRLLYYAGLKNTSNVWAISYGASSAEYFTQFPFAGHVDDPYNPTLDLNFGVAKEIYWDNRWQAINWTDKNLVNAHWRNQLIETTDKNSKIAEAMFWLRPLDAQNISFQPLYRFDNAYFRLLTMTYSGEAETLTKMTFLKAIQASPYTPSNVLVDGSTVPGGPVFGGPTHNNNTPHTIGQVVQGRNNTVLTKGPAEIMGDNNFVGPDAENVTIKSSNVMVAGGVSNVMVINSDGVEITTSNTTVINGQYMVGGDVAVTLTTGTYDLPTQAKLIEVDISGGNITINLPPAEEWLGMEYQFKVIDFTGGNTCKIQADTGELIDGSGLYTMTALWEVITLKSDGIKILIV